ncbi:hypothetical protein OG897_38440 [Streptomyces sp. NBC_00237]|uniref:hypothetical protein n=1 Tax=Streptomyces sp. NBC_00237 TaxID=2975687 RepID=UPI00224DB8B7|nr:hypothetical protein [Streptomyces sp. NBC_00237]MCX5207271.1 hypothetical protein [Streptomyces sp. NBC_00237]
MNTAAIPSSRQRSPSCRAALEEEGFAAALRPDSVVPIGRGAAGDPAEPSAPDRHAELWERQRGTPVRATTARPGPFHAAHIDDRLVEG